jgi:meckelin
MQPNASNLASDAAPTNKVLRFFVVVLLWLSLAYSQLGFRHVIYQRYIKDAATQFMDLLSCTNISAFIFDHKFHLFYIHGKSPHSFADTTLEDLRRHLQQERKNWVQSRGLVEGKDAFHILASPELRAYYESEYSQLLTRQILQGRALSRTGEMNIRDPERGSLNGSADDGDIAALVSDELVRANASLNQFFMQFIERNLPAMKWDVMSRTFFEKRFELPPVPKLGALGESLSVFYEDHDNSWTSTTLMGLEHHFIILYALMWSVSDLLFSNTIVSALIVYLLDKGIVAARSHWGEINLSKKSLIDAQFLI